MWCIIVPVRRLIGGILRDKSGQVLSYPRNRRGGGWRWWLFSPDTGDVEIGFADAWGRSMLVIQGSEFKIVKKMVCRWVGHHESFRASQHLLPFKAVDVLMTLGLGVGSLDVPFEESVVGKVGEMFNPKTTTLKDLMNKFDGLVFNESIEVDVICRLYILVCFLVFYFPRKSRVVSNMPCLVLDDLDRLSDYVWGSVVHKYLVRSLNRCSKIILSGVIADSLSISGNAAVLQIWAFERLSLHHHSSHKIFPRVTQFRSFHLRTKAIDVLFKTSVIQFDWYLSDYDCQQPLIRAAFHMDDGARPECSRAAADQYENDGDERWESEVEEKIGRNNMKIKRLREKIKGVRKELGKLRKIEEDPSSQQADDDVEGNDEGGDHAVHEKGLHEVYEEPTGYEELVGGKCEEFVGGKDAELAGGNCDKVVGEVHEQPTDEVDKVGVGEVHRQPAEEVDEVGVGEGGVGQVDVGEEDDEAVSEGDYEPLCATLEHPTVVIDIVEDDGDAIVEPISIRPLRTLVGDPRTTIDLDILYMVVSAKGIEWRFLDEIDERSEKGKRRNQKRHKQCMKGRCRKYR
ncbi:hypothetical protein LR48_Vigan09g085400 [Vigna angularis]|uniref:Aminotransferase-like plant mobile domain-containing protein n=1 Tax=Phaseolus angularis TaxID=3914 RepID=A0A0L9VAV2_PHAAN|nr:hypothetical protein LR48_Vigan09g085400 [Vigna angularis]